MRLYKIDFKNAIGDNVVTVPTDSEFLVGLGNGDSTSTAKLYDGSTELSAMFDKIGDYTCFKIETGKYPFVKEYKGLFSGFNPVVKYWDAHSYDITDGTKTGNMAIVDADVFAVYNASDPSHPTPPTAETIKVKFKDASGHYSVTLTYTYDKTQAVSGVPASFYNAPAEIDETITSAYPVPKIIRFKNAPTLGWNWNKIEPNYTGQSSTVNWKATTLVADIEIPYTDDAPYTQEVKIRLTASKSSIAYRDLEGSPEDIVEAVSDSGKFLEKEDGAIIFEGNTYEPLQFTVDGVTYEALARIVEQAE